MGLMGYLIPEVTKLSMQACMAVPYIAPRLRRISKGAR